jgi:hypothetical protein
MNLSHVVSLPWWIVPPGFENRCWRQHCTPKNPVSGNPKTRRHFEARLRRATGPKRLEAKESKNRREAGTLNIQALFLLF